MADVWFIRHGECTANVGEATKTAAEAGLTSRGYEQAVLVAKYLQAEADKKLTRIISSPYQRALQTARPARVSFAQALFEIKSVEEFNYLSLPEDVRTTSADRLPLVKDYWERSDPYYQHREHAESFASFVWRVQRVLTELRACEQDELIIVFSHQQFIQGVRWVLQREREQCQTRLQADDMRQFYQFLANSALPNCAILKTSLRLKEQTVWPHVEVGHLADELVLSGIRR